MGSFVFNHGDSGSGVERIRAGHVVTCECTRNLGKSTVPGTRQRVIDSIYPGCAPGMDHGCGVVQLKPSDVLIGKDRVRVSSPLRCPVCDGALRDVFIRDLGGVTADLVWQLHAGECPDHGWFQCEVISKPPREIFPVERPFGTTRRLLIDGDEVFAFATVWNDLTPSEKRQKVDPFDRQYWKVRRPETASV